MEDRSLYAFLDSIESRPGMYLLTPTFGALVAVIAGYEMALAHHGYVQNVTPPFSGFTEWLAESVRASQTPVSYESWAAIIQRLSDDDDEKALSLFFQYLHRYRGEGHTPPPAVAVGMR